eukprot:jgi/Undpi1/5912/HiC_scaffold_2.g01186.m1
MNQRKALRHVPIMPSLFPTCPRHRTQHRQPIHEAQAHSDGGGGGNRSLLSRNRRGGEPGGKVICASRGGRPADPRRRDCARRNSSEEDRINYRTTTSDSDFVARGVAPTISVPERTIDGNAEQSDIESGQLLGRDCVGDATSHHDGQRFSKDDGSDDGEVDPVDVVRGDGQITTVGNGTAVCEPVGSKERAAKIADGACTSKAEPTTMSKSTPPNDDVSPPSSTSDDHVRQAKHGKSEKRAHISPNSPTLSTTRVESGQDPRRTDLPLNQQTETESPTQQKNVPNHATSAVVAGEKDGDLCRDDRLLTTGPTGLPERQTGAFAEKKDDIIPHIGGTMSPSLPTSSRSNSNSSAVSLQEGTGEWAPLFGGDALFAAAARGQKKSNAAVSSPDNETQVSSVFDPLTQTLEGARCDGGAAQNLPPSPRRGTKRKTPANITLAQVIDHHLARRRLNGVGGADDLSTQRDSLGRNTPGSTGRGKTRKGAHNKSPSTAGKQLMDGSTVVAAAWANGCVWPLTATAAPHMRLVAPVLAAEPEGRRIVIRTASAVAVGAAALALPGHQLEVTGVCRDGLLIELSPNTDLERGRVREGLSDQSTLASTLAHRLQAAFDKLVARDLEFNTVPLPHAETLDAVPPGSSSGELLKWRNDGTSALLYLARVSSAQAGLASEQRRDGDISGEVDGSGESSQRADGCFLGIDSEMGPLLPRTGLLGCFHVEVHPVPLLPKAKNHRAGRSSTVHLAMVLSDTGVFRGGTSERGGSRVAHDEGRGQLGAVATPPGPGGAGPNAAARNLRQLSTRLCCVPPTRTEDGLAWREVMSLKCVAEVSRLAFASKIELEAKIQLVERLHAAQIESLATKIASSGVLLVVLAGRQGASVEVMVSRLRVELTIKGKQPALVDTKTYLKQGASPKHVAGTRRSKSAASYRAPQHLDSTALGRAVASLLGQARAGAGLSGSGADVAATSEWQWCNVVIVYGSEALDVGLLPPGRVGLGPAEAISVFVDTVPQVCVDSMTPVNGADVRMLRSLIARGGSHEAADRVALVGHGGGGAESRAERARFDTASFLDEWLLAEDTEEAIWRPFRAAANVHLNTALPYDLHVLKPQAEPLLRSVAPPTSHSEGEGGDGCRSSSYALARSVLRILKLCEALHAPPLPGSSVLSRLIQSHRWV